MLKKLSIENFIIVETVEILFDEKLNIISGETGAGKSIILGALQLALGERADTKVFATNTKNCVIEIVFETPGKAIEKILKKEDIDFFNELILRREIRPNGNSRFFINDCITSANTLKNISLHLIDIHSQQETQRLRTKQYAINLLDFYSENRSLRIEYGKKYAEYVEKNLRLEELLKNREIKEKELDFLKFQQEQFQSIDIDKETFETYQKQIELSESKETLTETIEQVSTLLNSEEGGFASRLYEAHKFLEALGRSIEKTKPLEKRLKSVIIETEDIISEVENLKNSIYSPEVDIEALREKMNTIFQLQLKFKKRDFDELMAEKEQVESQVFALENELQSQEFLEKEIEKLASHMEKDASLLHQNRIKHTGSICKKINDCLSFLGMKEATIKYDIKSSETFNRHGKSEVQLLGKTNVNTPFSEVSKIASGGELSRIMLSLKKVLSEKQKLPTIIFDEIDTGVSGEMSHKIGQVIQALSKSMQVICISHSPQIVAKGNKNIKILKENGEKTVTKVLELNAKEKIQEVARMMSGEDITDNALKTALELIEHPSALK